MNLEFSLMGIKTPLPWIYNPRLILIYCGFQIRFPIGKSDCLGCGFQIRYYYTADFKSTATELVGFDNGGFFAIHNMVRKRDSKDFDNLKHAARLMAQKGREVVILPEINVKNPLYLQIFGENAKHYPNKCPDMIVDGKYFYEHKGFTTSNPDKSAVNMINKALKQSSRIIIEEPLESKHDVREIIEGKIRNGKKVDEVYIAHKNELELVYKKNESNR